MAKKRPQTKAEPTGQRCKAFPVRAPAHVVTELVHRPFEGLPGKCGWVALRELLPAAMVELPLKGGQPEGVPSVTLATVLPMAWPALRCDDGSVLLGLQNDTASGDISRGLTPKARSSRLCTAASSSGPGRGKRHAG